MELPYEEEFFDYIIIGDVMPHLLNPWDTLKNIKKYLKKDGNLICSIPNIMYIDVLIDIIKGNFTYTDTGLLNRENLRFFTLNEIQRLFTGADLRIDGINALAAQPTADAQNYINALTSISNAKLRDQYLVYQYIVKSSHNMPVPKYEQNNMLDLKFKLMRLDNDIDVENSLNSILDFYLENRDSFVTDLYVLLNESVLEKEKVVGLIANAALERNLNDLYESLKQ